MFGWLALLCFTFLRLVFGGALGRVTGDKLMRIYEA